MKKTLNLLYYKGICWWRTLFMNICHQESQELQEDIQEIDDSPDSHKISQILSETWQTNLFKKTANCIYNNVSKNRKLK